MEANKILLLKKKINKHFVLVYCGLSPSIEKGSDPPLGCQRALLNLVEAFKSIYHQLPNLIDK